MTLMVAHATQLTAPPAAAGALLQLTLTVHVVGGLPGKRRARSQIGKQRCGGLVQPSVKVAAPAGGSLTRMRDAAPCAMAS